MKASSLEFKGTWYTDVYVIKKNTYYYTDESEIFLDSVWYNTARGILKLGMNDEYYQLIPDYE